MVTKKWDMAKVVSWIAKVLRTEVPAVSMDGMWSPEPPTDALRALFGSISEGLDAPREKDYARAWAD